VSLSANLKDESKVGDVNVLARNLAVHVAGFQPSTIGKAHLDGEVAVEDRKDNPDAETLGEKVADDLMSQPFSIMGGGSVGSRILKLSQDIHTPILVSSFVRWELGGREGSAGFRE
jgi:translation elongation factor EF-Ts